MRLVEEGGGGGLWSKTNELMIFFRIKDNIIVAKSVLIAEKALHLRQFFANKVKKQDAKWLRRSMKHLRRNWFIRRE